MAINVTENSTGRQLSGNSAELVFLITGTDEPADTGCRFYPALRLSTST